eukprot:2653085-Prymnesium_polylepis.1
MRPAQVPVTRVPQPTRYHTHAPPRDPCLRLALCSPGIIPSRKPPTQALTRTWLASILISELEICVAVTRSGLSLSRCCRAYSPPTSSTSAPSAPPTPKPTAVPDASSSSLAGGVAGDGAAGGGADGCGGDGASRCSVTTVGVTVGVASTKKLDGASNTLVAAVVGSAAESAAVMSAAAAGESAARVAVMRTEADVTLRLMVVRGTPASVARIDATCSRVKSVTLSTTPGPRSITMTRCSR